jgi:thiamine pyrophosphokinase
MSQIPILLMGGLSGRVDQTVHTMSLLHKLRARRSEVYVLNGESVAWVLDEVSPPFPSISKKSEKEKEKEIGIKLTERDLT